MGLDEGQQFPTEMNRAGCCVCGMTEAATTGGIFERDARPRQILRPSWCVGKVCRFVVCDFLMHRLSPAAVLFLEHWAYALLDALRKLSMCVGTCSVLRPVTRSLQAKLEL